MKPEDIPEDTVIRITWEKYVDGEWVRKDRIEIETPDYMMTLFKQAASEMTV